MSWPVVPLGEIAETALGKMLDRGTTRGLPLVPYLRNVNVQWGTVNTSDLLLMELADDERARFGVRDGDLLVCEGGEIGRCAIWTGSEEYLAYQKALHRIRPSADLDVRYLRYLFEHHATSGKLARLSTGTTISHLPQQQLRRVPVPKPPVDSQRRIVEALESYFSRLDAATNAVIHATRRSTSLRDAALEDALVQARNDADTSVASLGDLAKVSSGMTPLKANKAFYEGGTVPWVTSGDLHQGLITAVSRHVTQTALDNTSLKVVPAGTLLVAMYGEGRTRGTAAELTFDATTNQACAAVVLHDPSLRPWVRLVLDANYSRLRRLAAGGVQPNLNLSVIKAIKIPLPAPDLRARLVDQRSHLDGARSRLEAQLALARRRRTSVRRSLLAAAFSGALTS